MRPDAERDELEDLFQPLQLASRPRLIAAVVLGPVAWIVALTVATYLVARTDAIEFGLLVTACSFVVAVIVLGVLRVGRLRERRRYEERA